MRRPFRNPLLQVGSHIATLRRRGEVEGVITVIDEVNAEAGIRLTTAPFTGLFHVEKLAHLVPIGRDGRPLEEAAA